MPVLMMHGLAIKERKTLSVKPEDHLGTMQVTGDGAVKLLALTPAGKGPDAGRYGPGGSYYQAYQTCTAYGKTMVVVTGTYDLWLVPADGGKPSLVEANLEVKAGQVTTVAN
jgi:hypothetical protein